MFGAAAAKTLLGTDGGSKIIVDLDHLQQWDTALLDRTFGHEGYHTATNQRAESLSDLRVRHSLAYGTHEGEWAPCAGMAAEEYRVERAVDDEGLGLSPSYSDTIEEALDVFRMTILDALRVRIAGGSIEKLCQSVMTAFHRLTLLMPYVAAADLATDGNVAPTESEAHWDRFVGEHYGHYRDALAAIPSAAVATPRAELDHLAFDLIPVFDAWLRHIGFEIRDEPAGLYFDVLRYDY
jgi:hypothetical protein